MRSWESGQTVPVGILARLFRRTSKDTRAGRPPAPKLGSPAQVWLDHADKTRRSLRELRRSDALSDLVAEVRDGADEVVEELRRLAGDVTLIEQAIARIPSPLLAERRARLIDEQAAAGGSGPSSASAEGGASAVELDRTLADVEAQLATDQRLRRTRDDLLTKMESGATALDGLIARVVELSAATTSLEPGAAGTVAELTARLDALRDGLAETDQLTRAALEGRASSP